MHKHAALFNIITEYDYYRKDQTERKGKKKTTTSVKYRPVNCFTEYADELISLKATNRAT